MKKTSFYMIGIICILSAILVVAIFQFNQNEGEFTSAFQQSSVSESSSGSMQQSLSESQQSPSEDASDFASQSNASVDSENRSQQKELKIHVVDAEGNPIPELQVYINPEWLNYFAGFTDENGNVFWKRPQSGQWTVIVEEKLKVFKKQQYTIQVTEQFTPVELVWDYENPALLPIPVHSVAKIRFVDQDENPVTDLHVTVGIILEGYGEGNLELCAILKPPDENGLIVWTNPEAGDHKLIAFSTKTDETFAFDLKITDQERQEFIFTIISDKTKE